MDNEETVGTLGIDVEANVKEYERESGRRLKESSERIGREAGRAMGVAMSEEAAPDPRPAKRAGEDLADQIIKGATERLRRSEALANQLKIADEKTGEAEGRRAADNFRKEILNGIRKLDELGIGDQPAFAKLTEALRDATKEGIEPLPAAITEAGREGADGFIGHLQRIQRFLTSGGLSFAGIFRAGTQEAKALNRETGSLFGNTGKLVGVMGTLLGILLTIAGIRALFRFAREARELALETDNANERLQALQDSVAGLRKIWLDFKIAVGQAMLELQGVERISDVVGAILTGLTKVINDNGDAWRVFGTMTAQAAEVLFRIAGVIGAFVLAPLGLLVKGLAAGQSAYIGFLDAGERVRAFLRKGGLAEGHEERIAAMRKEADAVNDLADDIIEAGRKAARLGVLGLPDLPQVTGAGATTTREQEEAKRAAEKAAREAQRRAEERLQLEEQLQQRLAQLTMDATAIALRELDKLVEAYRKAGGEIGGQFEQDMNRVRELITAGGALTDLQEEFNKLGSAKPTPETLSALQALSERVEAYRDVVKDSVPLTEQLNALLDQIARKGRAIEADALVSDLRDAFERRKAELASMLSEGLIDRKQYEQQAKAAADAFVRAFNARIKEHAKKLRAAGLNELADELERAMQVLAKEDDGVSQRIRALRDQARAFEENVRAATQLAEAVGLIDESAATTLQSLAQLGASIARIAAGDMTAILPAIGAAVQLGQSLFGDSPAEIERKRVLQENTRALDRLARGLANLSGLVGESGGDIANIQRAAAATREGGLSATLRPMTAFARRLAEYGLTIEDAERVARSFGLELNGTMQSIIDLDEAVKQLTLDMLWASTEGREEMMRREERIKGIEDEQTLLERRRTFLLEEANLSEEDRARLAGFDLSTPAGRAAMAAFAAELFDRLKSGEITIGELGGLGPADLLAWAEEVVALARSAAEESGVSEGFQVSRTITEVTANRMVGTLTTIAALIGEYNRAIAQNTAGILAALTGGQLPALPQAVIPTPAQLSGGSSESTGGVMYIEFNQEFNLTDTSRETASEFGQVLSAAVLEQVDRGLGTRSLNYRRSRGLQ
jgi:hypothetical protein